MKHRGKGTFGSPRHTQRASPGPTTSASLGERVGGAGPGSFAMRVTPHNSGSQPNADGAPPKGLSRYTQE